MGWLQFLPKSAIHHYLVNWRNALWVNHVEAAHLYKAELREAVAEFAGQSACKIAKKFFSVTKQVLCGREKRATLLSLLSSFVDVSLFIRQ
jgi:hypothetical protein